MTADLLHHLDNHSYIRKNVDWLGLYRSPRGWKGRIMPVRWLTVLGWWVLLIGAAPAADSDAKRLADRIDQRIASGWAEHHLKPAPRSDDAEFVRRVCLDIAGKIPRVSEVRRFLADAAPDKRQRLIDRLLDSPAYVTHFSTVWRLLLVPEGETNPRQRSALPMLEDWLRQQLADDVGYDQMVRAVLTVPLDDPRRSPNDPSPRAFYLGKETKPEELAARATRVFLGLRLECAQCHDHPFARWKRDDFWSQAAFFASPADRMEVAIPGTKHVVPAGFLDGTKPEPRAGRGARQAFADWLITADNPFFARAAVNRLWAHFFGIGLVEPFDDMTDANLPSHPELLDELARAFAGHRFDVKFIIRTITLSKTYQLSGATPGTPPRDPRLFGRMALKSLTPEQLFDSLAQATGYRDPPPIRERLLGGGGARQQFLTRFSRSDKRTDMATSIPQALALMNGAFVAQATSVERSTTLNAVAHAPFMDTAERIETLFLATLSRKPRPDEATRLAKYVGEGGTTGDPKEALADVFWALLNSGEFLFNH
jgi:hypothetical protein